MSLWGRGLNLAKGMLVRHYKGGKYVVEGVAKHSNTLEPMVLYRSISKSRTYGIQNYQLWSRTMSEFCGTVEVNKTRVHRFQVEKQTMKSYEKF